MALRVVGWAALVAVLIQTVSFGMARVGFKSPAVMYGYVVAEAVLVAVLLYWAAWHFEVARLGRGLVFAIVIGAVLAVAALIFFGLRGHERPEEPNLGRPVMTLIDSGYFPVAAAAVILALSANWAGKADASQEQYFQVLQSDPSIVVLRRYDDRLIAARLVRAGVIERNVRYVLVDGGLGQRRLERRKLGELRPAEE